MPASQTHDTAPVMPGTQLYCLLGGEIYPEKQTVVDFRTT
jgi:hypothetical protein